jgi:hypothetical protein
MVCNLWRGSSDLVLRFQRQYYHGINKLFEAIPHAYRRSVPNQLYLVVPLTGRDSLGSRVRVSFWFNYTNAMYTKIVVGYSQGDAHGIYIAEGGVAYG